MKKSVKRRNIARRSKEVVVVFGEAEVDAEAEGSKEEDLVAGQRFDGVKNEYDDKGLAVDARGSLEKESDGNEAAVDDGSSGGEGGSDKKGVVVGGTDSVSGEN